MIYSLSIYLYVAAVHLAARWNKKASAWVTGRKDWEEHAKAARRDAGNKAIVWVHCASLGEFEQGRPVIESLHSLHPKPYILLTFFSPSGFEIRKNYAMADTVMYLPADTPRNARIFVDILRPSLAVFVKYEYWLNLLACLHKKNIPVLMISAIFRQNQVFFAWYGAPWRKALSHIRQFFLQDEGSQALLQRLGITETTVAGDTRFDRVLELARGFQGIPEIEDFCKGTPVLVAGSTWPEDESLLAGYLREHPQMKCIIAPHEIHEAHLQQIEAQIPRTIRFSAWKNERKDGAQVLVIDNIGMLSRLYYYAAITYIGGGFGKGIHNTLEAAVYGKPVLFGPRYDKFREARELVAAGAAVAIHDQDGLRKALDNFMEHPQVLQQAGLAAKNYVQKQAGATKTILDYIQANRLLTS